MKYDEHIVVDGLRNKDPEAYKMMVSRFEMSLFIMVYTMVNNKHDASDIVTHTFEDAFLKIHYYTPVCKFSTWLFSIGKNNCIDFLRTKHEFVGDAIDVADVLVHRADPNPTPEQQFIRNQEREIVQRAMGRLKFIPQLYVNEFYFNGLRYHEIADKYQVPSSTIRVHVLRAKRKLQELLTNN